MDVEKILSAIKAFFTAKGIQLGDNEAALKAELERMKKENPSGDIDLLKLDLTKFGNSDSEKVLKAILEKQGTLENALTKALKIIEDDASNRKTEKENLDKQKKETHDKAVKEAVDNLIVTKKAFPESMREHLTAMATANLDSFKEIYKEAKTGKEFDDKKGNEKSGNEQPAIKSTSGNAKALDAIQKFQVNSVTSN